MKNRVLTIIALALLMNAGCAKENSRSAPSPVVVVPQACVGVQCVDSNGDGIPDAPVNPTTTTPNTSYPSGSGVPLLTSTATLAKMFFNSLPNNPTNIRINIDLNRASDAVIISYIDNGRVFEAGFGGSHPYNASVSGTKQSGWATHNGQPVWKGFFQDNYGAIVVVIDSTLNTGDGTPAQFIGGRVYFINFPTGWPYAPQGEMKMCWDITLGPYDCRTFLQNNTIVWGSSLNPQNAGPTVTEAGRGYQLLGSFTGMSRVAAGLP